VASETLVIYTCPSTGILDLHFQEIAIQQAIDVSEEIANTKKRPPPHIHIGSWPRRVEQRRLASFRLRA
jgi:hypothetical protein